ncbi:MOSC domain-containing protein [Microbacterium sp. NPDC076911]|uniref:MOSC domain-containing protein n=1 Tax=Microbacterium sp. NPDC076911 TaxID=3154958 RepID=UPI003440D35A
MSESSGQVVAVASDDAHRFSKPTRDSVTLVAGLGIAGDAHAGATVQHLAPMTRHPERENVRQVHLIHEELFEHTAARGHSVSPGDLGENITTRGLDLLAMGRGTRLEFESGAVVELTGLRNPCAQINGFSPGLMKELIYVNEQGDTVRLVGVMSIVIHGGEVRAGDDIRVIVPDMHEPLLPV